jgi:predicted transcriptional regulator
MNRKPTKALEVVFQTGDDLSGVLRAMLDDSGLNRHSLAQQAGISESTLSRMYTGKRPATAETMVTVAITRGDVLSFV